MKNILNNRWLIYSLRITLGLIFIVGGVAKIPNISKFVNIVISYSILPSNLAHLYGNVAPWVELFIGCSLVLGLLVQFSLALLVPLIISFIVANSYALIKTISTSCGCFGTFLSISHPVSLTIDIFILFSAFFLLFNQGPEFLSIGSSIDRLKFNISLANRMPKIKNTLRQISRLSSIAMSVFLVAGVSIGLHNVIMPAEKTIETVNLPSPLSNEVDNTLSQSKPVLLEFYVEDCDACQAAAPVISEMETEFNKEAVFILIDYYANPEAASDLNIRKTPTVVIISGKNSKAQYNVVFRADGVVDQASLQTFLEQAIKGE
jgi:thiol-disulfide isomerase/thioredoxin